MRDYEGYRTNRTHLSRMWQGACMRSDWWIKMAYDIQHTPKHERNPWPRLNRQARMKGIW